MNTVLTCDFYMLAFFEPFVPLKNTWFYRSSSPHEPRTALHSYHLQSFQISQILRQCVEAHISYQSHNFHAIGVNGFKS